jgi:serine/threonine-protein kinase SRPK3
VAELTGKNSEIKIHRHLASQSGIHPGSDRILALLDHFKVQGVNGEHDVLVLQVIGPQLEAMFDEEPTAVQQAIKSLVHEVALGTSFLHECGVVHAGRSAVLLIDQQLTSVIQICTKATLRSRSLIWTGNPRNLQ